MGFFSRKPKPNEDLLWMLLVIAKLKSELPLISGSEVSGQCGLFVQHVINQERQIVTIMAGDDMFAPSIIFSKGIPYPMPPGPDYLRILKYIPGNWESLVVKTLEYMKQAYKEKNPSASDNDYYEYIKWQASVWACGLVAPF